MALEEKGSDFILEGSVLRMEGGSVTIGDAAFNDIETAIGAAVGALKFGTVEEAFMKLREDLEALHAKTETFESLSYVESEWSKTSPV